MKLNPKVKSVLIFCLKLVVTLVPAYFVYQNIVSDPEWDVSDLYRLFEKNSVTPLVMALLCLAVSNFTACYQWKLLLEKQGVRMTYGKLLKLYHVGLFFNNFMPGNVGGDVKKVYHARQASLPLVRGAQALGREARRRQAEIPPREQETAGPEDPQRHARLLEWAQY